MLKKLFVLAFLLPLPLLAAPKPVDIVIAHGTVLTMAGPNIEDGAVAIDKGNIVAVGTSPKIATAYHGKETINAAAATPAAATTERPARAPFPAPADTAATRASGARATLSISPSRTSERQSVRTPAGQGR